MKLIISGGRDYKFSLDDIHFLNKMIYNPGVSEVVSGGCRGADECGERWAKSNGIPVKRFPAEDYGEWPFCGPRRNRAMAQYADGVVLFPGGKGTANMEREAMRHGLTIYENLSWIQHSKGKG